MADNTKEKVKNTEEKVKNVLFHDARPIEKGNRKRVFVKEGDFHYARHLLLAPLALSEVVVSSYHYPIIISQEERPKFVAVLGVRDKNLFVENQDQWRADTYIPAHVRRYPFVLVEGDSSESSQNPDEQKFVFAVENSCVTEGPDGEYLFDESGKETDYFQGISQLLLSLRQGIEASTRMTAALKEEEFLFEPNESDSKEKNPYSFKGGLYLIDPAKLEELPDALIVRWYKRNWLPLIYAQLHSQRHWNSLFALAQKQRAEE